MIKIDNKRISNIKEIANPDDKNHQDSVWYDGEVLKYTVDNRFNVVFIASGDVSIYDSRTDDSYSDPTEIDINNDSQLQQALENNRIEWKNNNWFEFSIVDKKTGEYITDFNDDLIVDSLKDCWNPDFVLEFIDNYLRTNNKKYSK